MFEREDLYNLYDSFFSFYFFFFSFFFYCPYCLCFFMVSSIRPLKRNFFYKKNTVGFDPIRIGADSYFIGYGILNTDYYSFELQMHGTSSLLPIR